jgi:5-methylcytosine-specific restriction endonuclease McrA
MRPWEGRYRKQWTEAVLAVHGRTCHLCRQGGADSADHVIPRSKGGPDSMANLRPAHHGCNSKRGTLSLAEWFALHPVPRRESLPPSRTW